MIEHVVESVRRAGAAARETRAALREGYLISDTNLAAAGANAVERILRRQLLSLHPAAWITPSANTMVSGDAWIVTPLTGTRSYVHWQPHYGVAAALIRGGETVLSVVHSPGTGSLFYAEKGRGMHASGGHGCTVADVGRHAPADDVANSLPLALAAVASGATASLHADDDLPVWEVAAGAFLVAEAGGSVLDRRGAPIEFTSLLQPVHGLRAGAPTMCNV